MRLSWFFFHFLSAFKSSLQKFYCFHCNFFKSIACAQLMVHSAIHVHNFIAQDISIESNNLGSHCERPNIKIGIYFSQKNRIKKKKGTIIIASIFLSIVLRLILWTKRLWSWLEIEKFYQEKLFPASLYFWVH